MAVAVAVAVAVCLVLTVHLDFMAVTAARTMLVPAVRLCAHATSCRWFVLVHVAHPSVPVAVSVA